MILQYNTQSISYNGYDMATRDNLQRFLFEKHNIRGEIVHLNATFNAIKKIHPYPLPIQQLLGKALAAVSLLSATLKYEGSLILQTQGDGPVNPLVAQASHQLHLRGLAKWDDEQIINLHEPTKLLGQGHLGITIIPDGKGERYQGVVQLVDDDLAASLENYFSQSEQLATRVWLFASETSAHGLLLQQMPEMTKDAINIWDELTTLGSTITAEELNHLSNEEILHRLFHEYDIRLFDHDPVCFRCQCSIAKMQQAIITMGREEANDLLKTHKTISVNCEFCNQHYEFDKVDVEQIFRLI